jgi:hypothetical protein
MIVSKKSIAPEYSRLTGHMIWLVFAVSVAQVWASDRAIVDVSASGVSATASDAGVSTVVLRVGGPNDYFKQVVGAVRVAHVDCTIRSA